MTLPARLLVHSADVVRPATSTDAHGNEALDYGPGATRTTIACRLQQDQTTETFPDGRNPHEATWQLFTNATDILETDRIEWADHPEGAVTFEVHGLPEPTYTAPGTAAHHLEVTLRRVEG